MSMCPAIFLSVHVGGSEKTELLCLFTVLFRNFVDECESAKPANPVTQGLLSISGDQKKRDSALSTRKLEWSTSKARPANLVTPCLLSIFGDPRKRDSAQSTRKPEWSTSRTRPANPVTPCLLITFGDRKKRDSALNTKNSEW